MFKIHGEEHIYIYKCTCILHAHDLWFVLQYKPQIIHNRRSINSNNNTQYCASSQQKLKASQTLSLGFAKRFARFDFVRCVWFSDVVVVSCVCVTRSLIPNAKQEIVFKTDCAISRNRPGESIINGWMAGGASLQAMPQKYQEYHVARLMITQKTRFRRGD